MPRRRALHCMRDKTPTVSKKIPTASKKLPKTKNSVVVSRNRGPDPLRFLRVALRIEISTRCVFCVAGRIFIGFLSLPNLVLKLNLNMPKRLRFEATYRSKTLSVLRVESAFRNGWTCEFQHENGVLKIVFSTRCVSAKRILGQEI